MEWGHGQEQTHPGDALSLLPALSLYKRDTSELVSPAEKQEYLNGLCAALMESDGFWIRSGGLCPPGHGCGDHRLILSDMERHFVYRTVKKNGKLSGGYEHLNPPEVHGDVSPLNLLTVEFGT